MKPTDDLLLRQQSTSFSQGILRPLDPNPRRVLVYSLRHLVFGIGPARIGVVHGEILVFLHDLPPTYQCITQGAAIVARSGLYENMFEWRAIKHDLVRHAVERDPARQAKVLGLGLLIGVLSDLDQNFLKCVLGGGGHISFEIPQYSPGGLRLTERPVVAILNAEPFVELKLRRNKKFPSLVNQRFREVCEQPV